MTRECKGIIGIMFGHKFEPVVIRHKYFDPAVRHLIKNLIRSGGEVKGRIGGHFEDMETEVEEFMGTLCQRCGEGTIKIEEDK